MVKKGMFLLMAAGLLGLGLAPSVSQAKSFQDAMRQYDGALTLYGEYELNGNCIDFLELAFDRNNDGVFGQDDYDVKLADFKRRKEERNYSEESLANYIDMLDFFLESSCDPYLEGDYNGDSCVDSSDIVIKYQYNLPMSLITLAGNYNQCL